MNKARHLARLLLENSTTKFYIEYEVYLFNHMSHGIVALHRLGASEARIQKFIDWYAPRLEDDETAKIRHDEHLSSPIMASSSINLADGTYKMNGGGTPDELELKRLLGAGKSFYRILELYEKQLKSLYGGSVEKMVGGVFPNLCRGLVAAALHGLIHIGYGYSAGQPRIVCEGLAHLHMTFLPLNVSEEDLCTADQPESETTDILDVIENVRRNEELLAFMHNEGKNVHSPSRFTQRSTVLFSQRAKDILDYARQIKLPKHSNNGDQWKHLMRYALDCAITVYTASEVRNDFFLLHGVTAAWSLLQIIPLLDENTSMLSVRMYLCSLVAVYLIQDVPRLSMDLLHKQDDTYTWDTLIAQGMQTDLDEHVYKLMQICYELSQEDCIDPKLANIYKNAVITAVEHPFTF